MGAVARCFATRPTRRRRPRRCSSGCGATGTASAGEASPTTYLFKVTTTTCLNRLRTRRRRPEDPVEELPPPSAPTTHRDTALRTAELRQLLELVLKHEDERTVNAVIYHYADGMTHDEVGKLLGVTGAAIRKRIAQFRARVAKQMPQLELEDEP